MNRLIIGISGASGSLLGIELLKALRLNKEWETHLIVSPSAEITLLSETAYTVDETKALADVVYDFKDIAAAVSSGSFKTAGMVVAPCSMKTLAGIASGYSDNLLLRSADVILKERRKLVLAVRESPLSVIHIKNMLFAAQAGAIILPPMLTYYSKPENILEMTRHVVGKILDQFQIDNDLVSRWREERKDHVK